MKTHFFILFFSLLLVYSCKKEKVPVEAPRSAAVPNAAGEKHYKNLRFYNLLVR